MHSGFYRPANVHDIHAGNIRDTNGQRITAIGVINIARMIGDPLRDGGDITQINAVRRTGGADQHIIQLVNIFKATGRMQTDRLAADRHAARI